MPSKRMGESRVRSPKTITVTTNFGNAKGIYEGDKFKIRKGEDWQDGDLVAVEALGDVRILYLFKTKDNARGFYGKPSLKSRTRFSDYLNILGPVVEVRKPGEKKKREVGLLRVEMTQSYHVLGLHGGDNVIFKPDCTAPVGKLIGVYNGEDEAWFARVCLNDARGVFLLLRSGEREWLGEYEYKSFGPVVKIERASEVNAKKIAALKERLEKIRRNDFDSICDTTRLFTLERELYALEHPKEEDETDSPGDEWPEVIGEGGEP